MVTLNKTTQLPIPGLPGASAEIWPVATGTNIFDHFLATKFVCGKIQREAPNSNFDSFRSPKSVKCVMNFMFCWIAYQNLPPSLQKKSQSAKEFFHKKYKREENSAQKW